GVSVAQEHSHKSYRPLCVLTFRLNYWLHELRPMGYHLGNVLLHCAVCLLFLRLSSMFLSEAASVAAALLFAVQPVHTEAVTGVVGRAESLSSVFFLLAFLAYSRCAQRWSSTGDDVMGFAVSRLLHLPCFMISKIRFSIPLTTPFLSSSLASHDLDLRSSTSTFQGGLFFFLVLLFARLLSLPHHTWPRCRFDNPAAASPSPTRQLTFWYLLPLNSWLLLFPWGLCCDWTMGSVPLVQSPWDPRNAATLALLAALAALAWTAFCSASARHSDVIFVSLSLVAFPFLPASNLFFHVGFVVAERILYLPSMGFCLLVAHGWHTLLRHAQLRSPYGYRFLWLGLLLVIATHSIKTFIRNYDWESEYSIFMAGLRVNCQNAKLYNNVGHALEGQGQFSRALEYFLKAASVQPDDIGAHINVGRTYNNLLMYEEAERAFWKAKDLLPRPRPGEPYKARIAPNHLNVFLNLANLISRNGSRLEEADGLYRQAISMRVDYIQAYINRGDILIKLNRTKEAQEVYQRALQLDSSNADIHYNLGVVFLEQGKPDDALSYFNKALELDPSHEQALMNSAILIQESGSPKLRQVAFQRLQRLLERGKANERVYFNLGMLSMDESKPRDAERWFQDAIRVKADFRSALFNLALLLSDSGRHLEAVPHLLQLLQSHPDHVKGLILLGDIYINHLKDVDKAEECYERILSVEPSHVQAMHNLCVVHVQRGFLLKAQACLERALRLAPKEAYIAAHLDVVKDRIRRYFSRR
ncbi:unnamed protein product, partial [Ixodes hexagonus]